MIINPMWFYLANVCDGARTALFVFGGLIVAIAAIAIPVYVAEEEEPPKRWMLVSLIVGAALIIAGLFVPTKNTTIEMMAASLATPENVNSVIDGLKGFVDYVAEVMG